MADRTADARATIGEARVAESELTCREVVELVNDYLDDWLPEPARARFEQHLDDCPHCVVYIEQMRATIAATGRLRQEGIDPPVLDELLQAFRDWPRDAGRS
jgi:anti-sigma factor RsiW